VDGGEACLRLPVRLRRVGGCFGGRPCYADQQSMVTGSHGRYQWLMDRRKGIGHMLERCPEALLDRYVAVACFDSGPFHPNAEETAAGWRLENQLAYSPRLESLSRPPFRSFDEWYVFASPARLCSCEVFINFGGFTLQHPEECLAESHPTWDRAGAKALAAGQIRQQRQFWASWSCSAPNPTSPRETTSFSLLPTASCSFA